MFPKRLLGDRFPKDFEGVLACYNSVLFTRRFLGGQILTEEKNSPSRRMNLNTITTYSGVKSIYLEQGGLTYRENYMT